MNIPPDNVADWPESNTIVLDLEGIAQLIYISLYVEDLIDAVIDNQPTAHFVRKIAHRLERLQYCLGRYDDDDLDDLADKLEDTSNITAVKLKDSEIYLYWDTKD
jgi:hypothetical protein